MSGDLAARAHSYRRDPWHAPLCRCGKTRFNRVHQPLWWRLLYRNARHR